MIDKQRIKDAYEKNDLCLHTQFDFLGDKIKGKVRDIYPLGNDLLFVSTDRQSAFDVPVAHVPFKGQVLNQASLFWFGITKHIAPNHFIASPDPNITIGKKLKIFPSNSSCVDI